MKRLAIALTLLLIFGWWMTFYYSNNNNLKANDSFNHQTELVQARWTPNFWSLSPNMRLLARTVSAEARGESYLGQVAVGSVIMNRIRDSKFPNTLAGVIYQPWAFTAVARGHIWSHTPNKNAIRAALDSRSGWDPTYGSLYYYNAAKVTSYWIFSRPKVRTIGKHIFAR
jgi:N-acetylmuramoyl-L-alanine amidase